MRRDARITAFQYIFASQFTQQNEEEFTSALKKQDDVTFAKQIIESYNAHTDEMKAQIESSLVGYEYSRVYKADLATLYVALSEINYLGTPAQVAINEALEIAKDYSTERSAKFINGVLATIVKGKK